MKQRGEEENMLFAKKDFGTTGRESLIAGGRGGGGRSVLFWVSNLFISEKVLLLFFYFIQGKVTEK